MSVSSAPRLERAASRLQETLERQRIVWLTGIHLPQRVTLTPGADDLRLVGGAAPETYSSGAARAPVGPAP